MERTSHKRILLPCVAGPPSFAHLPNPCKNHLHAGGVTAFDRLENIRVFHSHHGERQEKLLWLLDG